jgi:hypothetical protein
MTESLNPQSQLEVTFSWAGLGFYPVLSFGDIHLNSLLPDGYSIR